MHFRSHSHMKFFVNQVFNSICDAIKFGLKKSTIFNFTPKKNLTIPQIFADCRLHYCQKITIDKNFCQIVQLNCQQSADFLCNLKLSFGWLFVCHILQHTINSSLLNTLCNIKHCQFVFPFWNKLHTYWQTSFVIKTDWNTYSTKPRDC